MSPAFVKGRLQPYSQQADDPAVRVTISPVSPSWCRLHQHATSANGKIPQRRLPLTIGLVYAKVLMPIRVQNAHLQPNRDVGESKVPIHSVGMLPEGREREGPDSCGLQLLPAPEICLHQQTMDPRQQGNLPISNASI